MSRWETVAMLFRDSKVQIGEIIIDAAIEETHSMQVRATDHPVESGSSVVDHVQVLPDSVRLEGIISNTPTSLLGLPIFEGSNRADTAFKQFEAIVHGGQLIDIVTTLKTYKSMVIEDFVVVRNASNAEALSFSCTAKHIPIVSSQLIEIQLPKMPRARKKKSLGKQPAVKAPEKVEQRSKSLLSALFGGS
jgi:hypothetical protein